MHTCISEIIVVFLMICVCKTYNVCVGNVTLHHFPMFSYEAFFADIFEIFFFFCFQVFIYT